MPEHVNCYISTRVIGLIATLLCVVIRVFTQLTRWRDIISSVGIVCKLLKACRYNWLLSLYKPLLGECKAFVGQAQWGKKGTAGVYDYNFMFFHKMLDIGFVCVATFVRCAGTHAHWRGWLMTYIYTKKLALSSLVRARCARPNYKCSTMLCNCWLGMLKWVVQVYSMVYTYTTSSVQCYSHTCTMHIP